MYDRSIYSDKPKENQNYSRVNLCIVERFMILRTSVYAHCFAIESFYTYKQGLSQNGLRLVISTQKAVKIQIRKHFYTRNYFCIVVCLEFFNQAPQTSRICAFSLRSHAIEMWPPCALVETRSLVGDLLHCFCHLTETHLHFHQNIVFCAY